MTSVQKSNQDRISVGNGNVIACEHIKNLHHWSVHVNLLQSWGSLWCGDSFASVYMRTPTARVTVKRYHGYGSRCPTHLCTLVPDDEGEYKLYQLLSVHACSGDGRKSYQTLKSKNIICISTSNEPTERHTSKYLPMPQPYPITTSPLY